MKTNNLYRLLKGSKRLLKLLVPALIVFLALLTGACKTSQTITQSSRSRDTIIVKETLKDTLIKIESDTASLKALLECDSLGRVRMKEILEIENGRKIRSPDIKLKLDTLFVECKVDSTAIYMKLKQSFEKHISDNQRVEQIKIKSLTKWQEVQIWIGRSFILLLILTIIIKIYSYVKK